MATTPTSLVNRLMGLEPCTDGLQLYGTGAVTVPAATTTLAIARATHAGKPVLIQSTGGLAITPVAATGTQDLYIFIFIATISGGNVTIDAKAGNASDVCGGVCVSGSSGGTAGTFGSASNSNLITFNGTTQGGLKGTTVFMWDVATNLWAVEINNVCSGVAATPFSNH